MSIKYGFKYDLVIFLIFLFISLFLNIVSLTFIFRDSLTLLRLVDSMPLYTTNYANIFAPQFTWNYFLSINSFGLDYLSIRYMFFISGEVFDLMASLLAIIERVFVQLIAFFGTYILCKYYLSKLFQFSKTIALVSFIAGLFYGFSPSFIIGDLPRPIIEFAYATLPWILWSFNRVILEKNWKYIIPCTILIALNIDEHFLWAGFPIILALYSGFVFLIKYMGEKKINLYPVLSFFGVMILFVLLVFYRLIIRFISFSPYSYALTKAGLDVPWEQATMLNMLRAMSHMSLPNIYVPLGHSIFQFLNSLMSLTLIIPAIAFLALLFCRKNWIVLFYGILLVFSILPFYVSSPFKWIHYWIFFNTSIGPAFRTWRVLDAYIALSLSVLMAFSLYYIFENLYKRRKHILTGCITVGILFIFCVYSWPLLTGDVNGYLSPVKVPKEYNNVYNYFTNISGNYRIIYVPDFSHSYGPNTNFKPFWSPRWGMIPEFLFFSSPKPTIPAGWSGILWNPYYKFTLSYYYWSLLREGDTKALLRFLEWTNLKYIVVHNDISAIAKRVEKSIQSLNNSSYFKLVFHDGFIYVFENRLTKREICVPSQLILVDGGYRVAKKLYNSINDSHTYGFLFIDQGISPKMINNTKIILTDKPESQLIEDLTFNVILEQYPEYVVYPYKHVVDFDPKNKWSRASLLDAENQVWHPFVNWKNYAWDFDYMKGVVFTINSKDDFTIPIKVKKSDNYILLTRCLVSDKGGKIKVSIDNHKFDIETSGNYHGFLWRAINLRVLNAEEHKITLQNVEGFNAVNLFVLIPEKEYLKAKKEVEKLIQNKTVIYILEVESDFHGLNAKMIKNPEASNREVLLLSENGKAWQDIGIVKNGTYRIALKGMGEFNVKIGDKSFILKSNSLNFTYSLLFNHSSGKYRLEITPLNAINLVKNPSFEKMLTGFPENWNISNIKDFKMGFDRGYEGKHSLKVSTTVTKEWTWSWIRSEPIDVEPGKEYLIITHMKVENAKTSHIPIEGYFADKKQWKQLRQIPPGVRGTETYDWKEFSYILKIPKNVTKIRVVLNAGWVLDKSKGEAITWFDNIQVIPLEEAPKLDVIWLYSTETNQTIDQLFEVKEKPAKVLNYTKINPTLWKVKVNATKPFMLSFAEAYDPLWEARIYKDGKLVEKVGSIPLYSVINGFWIDKTGELEIVIRYTPQDWFEIGLIISAITFVSSIGYLFYDWRREKGDNGLKKLKED